jgi:phosphinothricin acetyltransferase
MEIRPGRRDDLPALAALYDHYVEHTAITFDTEPFGVLGRTAWLESFAETGPHRLLAAVERGTAVGYASSHTFRPKAAYAQTVETSIYLAPTATRRGLGRALYEALLALLRAEPGVHRACAGITLPNPASIALHERCGFVPVGTFREVGFKHGRYWDVRWYEKDLASGMDA